MPEGANKLVESGLPLFFQVLNPDEVGIRPPPRRRGDALTTWVNALTMFQKEALIASGHAGKVWRLACDEGPHMNAHDAAPYPLAFLTVGMVASYMNEITALAERQAITIKTIKLTLDNYYTMEGSMPKRTLVGGVLPVELHVEIDGDAPRDRMTELVYHAVAASPINGLMRGKLENMFTLARNGQELTPSKAKPLGRPMYPDPLDRFALARPAPADPSLELIRRGGDTPRIEDPGYTSRPDASPAPSQPRILRIGGICRRRDDGINDITQLQYSPHGATFHFLSEEAPSSGGQGRAPDANTLISAGIAFCFMTQLARFAQITRTRLDAYRLIQDTHLALAGASGGAGAPSLADPVETHLYLDMEKDEDCAREILDMTEQTSFMQAFCRSDVKLRIKVSV
jgi:organic hydroperoxide reductase OsmC/OhrA